MIEIVNLKVHKTQENMNSMNAKVWKSMWNRKRKTDNNDKLQDAHIR